MDNSTNAITATLDESTIANIFKLLGTWGASLPDQPENIRRLRIWREVLQGIDVEGRARMATSPDILQAAFQYVPSPRMDGTVRRLDWEGIDPNKPHMASERDQMAMLLKEQKQWIKAGLISGPTTSSSEWPAVALLESFAKTGKPYPQINYTLVRSIVSYAPGILEAALGMARPEDVDEALRQPTPGSPSNPPVIQDLLRQIPVAESLARRGLMTGNTLNILTNEGRNCFFSDLIPAERTGFWLKAGMRADVRSQEGMFAEEVRASQGLATEKLLLLHRELNTHRTPEDQVLATWRLAGTFLMHGNTPEDGIPREFARALTAPAPIDESTSTGVVSFTEWLMAGKGHGGYTGPVDKALVQLLGYIKEQEGAEGLQRWTDAEGGINRVYGLMIAAILHPQIHTETSLENALETARKAGAEDELLAIEILKTPGLESFRIDPQNNSLGVGLEKILAETFSRKILKYPEKWLALLKDDHGNPALDPLQTLGIEFYPTLLSANLVSRIPKDLLFLPENRPAVWRVLACFPHLDQGNSLTGMADDPSLAGLINTLDVPALRGLLDKAKLTRGAGGWWQGLDPKKKAHIESAAPEISILFTESLLNEALPDAKNPARPKVRF